MSVEVGNIIEGKITGLAKFGAFVDLGNGKNGLVHISEVSDKYVEDINQELEEGQTIKVKVISIADDGKIALSIRKVAGESKAESTPAPDKKKPAPKRHNKPSSSKQDNSSSFDAMMNSFLKDSEDRLSDIRKNTEGKRGGRGSRRS